MQLTDRELERLSDAHAQGGAAFFPAPDGELPRESGIDPGEYRCPDCGRRVTVGPSGIEYGHSERPPGCPRRPPEVKPQC